MSTNTIPVEQPYQDLSHPTKGRGFGLSFGWRMVMPTIIALVIIVGFPLGYALYVAFHEYDLTEGGIGALSGLDNFRRVADMDIFIQAIRNTVVLTISVVVLELIIAFGLALLLNQPGLRFRNIYLGILLIPLLVSPIAVGLIWRLLLHPDMGAVNWVLKEIGLPGQEWLSVRSSAMPALVGVDAWHETSLMLLVLLAGLTSLPRDPIEAARVDGANKFQIFWTVMVPLMMPVILITVLIRMISAMKTYDLVYILTGGGPGGATETVTFRIWKIGFTNLDMGSAAAASILLLIAIMALTVVLIRVMRSDIAE